MAQLAQRLRFDLTDAFTRDVELFADLFKRVVGIQVDSEAHTKNFRFPRGELREHRMGGFADPLSIR